MEEKSKFNYGEQDICPKCGSENVRVQRIEKDVNILFWYECNECGTHFLDCFEFTCKGIVPED